MTRKLAFLSLGFGLLVVACQVVAGIERVDKVLAAADAEPDVAPSPPDAGADADPCAHAAPPGPPAIDDDPTTILPTFVMAMETLSFDTQGGPFGFDIDRTCTCDERPGTRLAGGSACVTKGEAATFCDGTEGIDNQFGHAVKTFPIGASIDGYATTRIAQGKQTLLIYLRGYNGRANDRQVEVGLAVSDGIREPNEAARCPGSNVYVNEGGIAEDTYLPAWCGTDPWTVEEGQLVNGFPVAFASAYVTDGALVLELERPVTVPLGELGLTLGSPVGVAKLVPEGASFGLASGVLVGRAFSRDFLAAAGSVILDSNRAGERNRLCESPLFSLIQAQICENLDVAQSRNLDDQPGYACDAISTAARFTARPVVAGAIVAPVTSTNRCALVDGGIVSDASIVRDYDCP